MRIEAKIIKDDGEEYYINGTLPTDEEIDFIFPTDTKPENSEKRSAAKWFRDLFVK